MDKSRRAAMTMLAASFLVGASTSLYAQEAEAAAPTGFDRAWLESVRQEARDKGVSDETIARMLTSVPLLPDVAASQKSQPEVKQTTEQYLSKRVTKTRIDKGRQFLQDNQVLLQEVEQKYGVPGHVIMAIWALESNFGDFKGKTEVVPALLTLAYVHPRQERREYFRNEAITALRLIDKGHTEIEHGWGSWAGAMGHTQFMPSSFERLAVDGDGDGHIDIWSNLADVFASTANYLEKNGWKAGQRWGREVKVPQNFNRALFTERLRNQINKTPDEWEKLGVRLPGGGMLPAENNMRAMLIAPDGPKGRIFMAYDNFRTVMAYNSSYKYALAVNMLADEIAERPAITRAPQPTNN